MKKLIALLCLCTTLLTSNVEAANQIRKYTYGHSSTGAFTLLETQDLGLNTPIAIAYAGQDRFLYIALNSVSLVTELFLIQWKRRGSLTSINFIRNPIISLSNLTGVAYDSKHIWVTRNVSGFTPLVLQQLDWNGNIIRSRIIAVGMDGPMTFDELSFSGIKFGNKSILVTKVEGSSAFLIRKIGFPVDINGVNFTEKDYYITTTEIVHITRNGQQLNVAVTASVGFTPIDLTFDEKHFYVINTT